MKDCNRCGMCDDSCKPARYRRVGISDSGCDCEETDTSLSINNSAATLNYKAEKHTDVFTGTQLGGIIALPDLRDVNIDYDFDAMCAELIYHKYGECGKGCRSLEDAWSLFSIDQEGALSDQIRYVRGANVYGCPQYLNVPATLNEYWFAGWRPNGQFGYYQAGQAPELPKNSDGDYLVMGEDPVTKRPIVAPLPLNKILANIVGNGSVKIEGTFTKIQETPAFTAEFNPVDGRFAINWSDWWPTFNPEDRIGFGQIRGQLIWNDPQPKLNFENGSMTYFIKGIRFDEIQYTIDKGPRGYSGPHDLTLKGISIPDGNEVMILDRFTLDLTKNWTKPLNVTVECNQTVTIAPGQHSVPYTFAYLYNDWSPSDDEGYMQATFYNTLQGWN